MEYEAINEHNEEVKQYYNNLEHMVVNGIVIQYEKVKECDEIKYYG